jgi:hypothetical protein
MASVTKEGGSGAKTLVAGRSPDEIVGDND